MHGGRNRQDNTDIAGTTIEIYNNTFLATQASVMIGGVPQEICEIHHNWFQKHSSSAQAVRASAKTIVKDNAYGSNPKAAK
ncbi:MAG: hypothetical protein WC340_05115 [Kiritimatiellia bacterium]